MSVAAAALVDALGRELAPLEARLADHPYVAAAEAGRLAREDLRTFAAQQARIIPSDLRSVALMVHRYGGTPSGEYFAAALQTEAAALGHLWAFGRALGATPESLLAGEPLPGALAYTHFVAWLALYGSDAEFAAAFLVNLPAWGRNCARLARALRERYGLGAAEVAFFELFGAEAPPAFREASLGVIQAGLDRGVGPDAVRHAARMLQAYELGYWDALAEAAGVARPG